MASEVLIADPRSSGMPWADRLGILASAGCIVHCLLTPVLLSCSALLAHVLPSEEHTHRALAFGVAALGALALVRGLRLHRRRRVAALMAAGLVCIATGALAGDQLPQHWMEICLTGCGSILMIAAHRTNHTFCAQCRCAQAAGPLGQGLLQASSVTCRKD